MSTFPKRCFVKILDRIVGLGDEPRPAGVTKLAAAPLYRIRQGDHRIVYTIDDKTARVEIVKVGHRSDVYR
ncbi:MAG: type II toxin-antitoxin system RelE/ParE family toxin [Fimbriimonadaceae bacterium]